MADWNKHQARALELAQKLREAEDSHNTIGAQQVRETAAKWYGKDKGKEGAFNFAQRVLADQQVAKNEADRAAREAAREAARVDQALAAGRIDQARTALAELERIRERGLRTAKDDAAAHLKVEQESGEKIKQARINIAKKAYDADMLKAGSEKNAQLRSQMEAQARREYHAAVASAEDEYTKRLEDAGKAAVKQSKDTEAAIARIRQAQTQDTARQNLQVEQDALSKLRAGREQALREAGDNLTERERLTREWGAKEVQQLTRVAEAQLILAKRSGEAKLKSDLDSIEKSGGSAAEKKSLIDGANANFARSNAEAYRAYYAAIGEAATRSSNQVQDASKAAREALAGKDGSSGLAGSYYALQQQAVDAAAAGRLTNEMLADLQNKLADLDRDVALKGLSKQTAELSEATRQWLEAARIMQLQLEAYEAQAKDRIAAALAPLERPVNEGLTPIRAGLEAYAQELSDALGRGENIGDALNTVHAALAALDKQWADFTQSLADDEAVKSAASTLQYLSREALDAALVTAEAAQNAEAIKRIQAELTRRNDQSVASTKTLEEAQRQLAEMQGQQAIPAWQALAKSLREAATQPGLDPEMKAQFEALSMQVWETGRALDDYAEAVRNAALDNTEAQRVLERGYASGNKSFAEYNMERAELLREQAQLEFEALSAQEQQSEAAKKTLAHKLRQIDDDAAEAQNQHLRDLAERRAALSRQLAETELDIARQGGLDAVEVARRQNEIELQELEAAWTLKKATLKAGSEEYLMAQDEFESAREKLRRAGNAAVLSAEAELADQRQRLRDLDQRLEAANTVRRMNEAKKASAFGVALA